MKKIIIVILSFTAAISLLAACGKKDNTTLSLNAADKTLSMYQSFTLTADTDAAAPVWESTGGNILHLEVSADKKSAVVTAVGAGTSVITVKAGKAVKTCGVTVTATDLVPLFTTGITATQLITGEDIPLTPSLTFDGAPLAASYSYTSSDTAVATVSQSGVISALKAGEARIEIKASYHNFSQSAFVDVTVKPAVYMSFSKQDVLLYEYVDGIDYKNELQVTAALTADGVTQSGVAFEFTSENTAVATVDSNGLIKSKDVGKTKIKVECEHAGGDYYGYIFVEVVKLPLVNVTLSSQSEKLYDYYKQTTLKATVTVDGEELTDVVIEWSSSDNTVADVSDGRVTAKKSGSATITATFEYLTIKNTGTCEIVSNFESVKNGTSDKITGNSGLIAEIKKGYELQYEREIDFNSKAKDDTFIDLHFIPKNPSSGVPAQGLKPDIEMLYFVLTDTDNPDNYVVIKVIPLHRYNGEGSYYWVLSAVKAGASGQTLAGFKGHGDNALIYGEPTVYEDSIIEWGTEIFYSFYGEGYPAPDASRSLAFSLDYAEKAIYVNKGGTMIKVLDLDDVSGLAPGDKAWGGFTNGKAKLSIYGDWYTGDNNDFEIIISSIDGNIPDAEFAEIKKRP